MHFLCHYLIENIEPKDAASINNRYNRHELLRPDRLGVTKRTLPGPNRAHKSSVVFSFSEHDVMMGFKLGLAVGHTYAQVQASFAAKDLAANGISGSSAQADEESLSLLMTEITCWRGPFLAYTSPAVAPEMRSVVFEQSLKLVSIQILILISTLHCMKPS